MPSVLKAIWDCAWDCIYVINLAVKILKIGVRSAVKNAWSQHNMNAAAPLHMAVAAAAAVPAAAAGALVRMPVAAALVAGVAVAIPAAAAAAAGAVALAPQHEFVHTTVRGSNKYWARTTCVECKKLIAKVKCEDYDDQQLAC